MSPLASLFAGLRRAAAPCGLPAALLLVPTPAAQAQRLLTLVPGVAEATSADDPGPSIGPVPTAVEVDLGLLRSAPAWLEVPTPDGSVLSAERTVFEDRGGGDLMWSGGHPDAGYDTVVLTVEGGRLVGRFGAAGGGAYQIHAAADGRGGMAPVGGPRPEGVPFCEVETVPDDTRSAAAHTGAGSRAADLPVPVSNPRSHDRLDILVAYTATAAENWAGIGGPEAAIRHAGDYLKMVFSNNELPVEPHIVHAFRTSALLDRAMRDGRLRFPKRPLLMLLKEDGDQWRLRHEHRADLVHLFTGEGPGLTGPCGRAFPLQRGDTARTFHTGAYAWTSNAGYCDYVATFVHEIGHNLGANHDPASAWSPQNAFRPYGFGHGNRDAMPPIGTAVSNAGQIEPFFSTPRFRAWGAVVGIAGLRDNERLLRETVHIGARYSDHLRSLEGVPAPPSDLRMRRDGAFARLSWQGNAPDADGYEVGCWDGSGPAVAILRVEGRSEATIPLERHEPGTVLKCEVLATKGEERSLRSGYAYLAIPGDPLRAPSDVVVEPSLSIVNVRWTDNSDNEIGFEVQLLEDGEPVARRWALPNETSESLSEWRVQPRDREHRVRVFAVHQTAASEAGESAAFRWRSHPLAPGPVADLTATAIGPTTVRVSWTGKPGSDYYWVSALLEGWRHRPLPVRTDRNPVYIEGLARGGRYTFEVLATNHHDGSLPSRTHLSLGARGAGPEAPSSLSVVVEGETARLNWKDNSDDELGFEIQSGSFRLALVPLDTTTALVPSGYVNNPLLAPRVYAYNERGFSLPAVFGAAPRGTCLPDAETLCLRDSRFKVRMQWRTRLGEGGRGRVVPAGTNDSGLFRFFDPENWEVLIKVLDGCAINGRIWVLGASTTDLGYWIRVTDTVTSDSRSYWNDPDRPASAIVDTEAFPLPCGAAATVGATSAGSPSGGAFGGLAAGPRASATRLAAADRASGRCEAGPTTLCLGSGRFSLGIEASTLDGERHEGLVAREGTERAGLFHFFDPENWEVLVKVLDGCSINGHHWVFAASATDMGLDLRVADAVTGAAKRYGTTAGQPAPAIVDTEALACAAGAAVR